MRDTTVFCEQSETDPGGQAGARRLRQELRQAAQDGGFVLAMQPRRDLQTLALQGAEAQLRWPRRRGVSPAAELMPLLERNGLAASVLGWMLREVCRAAAQWPGGIACIALPDWALADAVVLRLVGAALEEAELPPERLELAFGGTALGRDTDDIVLILAALRDLGLELAIEGFGGGSACLIPLRRLPLTAVKLDRALVRDAADDDGAARMIDASLQYAHAMGMRAVACGVETPRQLLFLCRAGCDMAQGSAMETAAQAPAAIARGAAQEDRWTGSKRRYCA